MFLIFYEARKKLFHTTKTVIREEEWQKVVVQYFSTLSENIWQQRNSLITFPSTYDEINCFTFTAFIFHDEISFFGLSWLFISRYSCGSLKLIIQIYMITKTISSH